VGVGGHWCARAAREQNPGSYGGAYGNKAGEEHSTRRRLLHLPEINKEPRQSRNRN
jgi:hypothetical protein